MALKVGKWLGCRKNVAKFIAMTSSSALIVGKALVEIEFSFKGESVEVNLLVTVLKHVVGPSNEAIQEPNVRSILKMILN